MATVCGAWGRRPVTRPRARSLSLKQLDTASESRRTAESAAPPPASQNYGPPLTIASCDEGSCVRLRPPSERLVLDHATALVFGVNSRCLQQAVRGGQRVAMVRQVAMYLAHVALGRNLTEAGRLYGRDRTTAAHACTVVEDLRENAAFDRAVAELERVVRLQMRRPAASPAN